MSNLETDNGGNEATDSVNELLNNTDSEEYVTAILDGQLFGIA